MIAQFRKALPAGEPAEWLKSLLESPVELGQLADLMTTVLPLRHEVKLAALRELNARRRAEQLLRVLESEADSIAQGDANELFSDEEGFPPPFSLN